MFRKLLLLSTVASLAAFPALAQQSTDQPTPLPAPAAQGGDMTPPPATDPAAPAQAEAPTASPPPAEAVIPAQAADQLRADTLIGMDVFDTNGDKVGQVKDILFNEDGQAAGVVLAVGGVLGVGAKSVGLNWSEVDVQPSEEVVKIQYNKGQLEAAPDFKTQEAQKAEADAAQMQLQQEGGSTTTSPATQ
jgi:sporulation protein YlmC with PRC-barrel domain